MLPHAMLDSTFYSRNNMPTAKDMLLRWNKISCSYSDYGVSTNLLPYFYGI